MFLRNVSEKGSDYFQIGAVGNKQYRGEDSYIVRQASFLDLSWGYDPRMGLTHRFDKSRLALKYLVKLLYRYGVSDVRLNHSLKLKPTFPYPSSVSTLVIGLIYHLRKGHSGFPTALRIMGQYSASRNNPSV